MASGQEGLDQKVQTAWLLAFYGPLLTEKQQEALRLTCEEDLSLSEIAAQTGISRQGVYDALRRGQEQLYEFERRLHVLERFQRMESGLREALRLIKPIPGEAARRAEDCIAALLQADEEEENGL